jgi:uncharacterized protein YndB with AHSA1/START domain
MNGKFQAIVKRLLDAPIERVYSAWTEPALLALWITEGGRLEQADVHVGGKFLILMGCGDGKLAPHQGEFRVLDYPHTIEFTWISDWTAGETLVRIELSRKGDKTEFQLVQSGLRDQASATDHQSGWDDFAIKSALVAK